MRRLLMWTVFLAGISAGQQFEVASVKPSGPSGEHGSEGGPGSRDPTHYSYVKADLRILIMIAWNLDNFQVSSKLPIDREEIDIEANVPVGTTKDDFRVMLQHPLEDRFHLKSHRETRDFPAYELSVAKSGAKLASASAAGLLAPAAWERDNFPYVPPDRTGIVSQNSRRYPTRLRAHAITLEQLASSLRSATQDPVVNRTGIEGTYDFLLEFTPEFALAAAEPPPYSAPDLKSTLQKKFGLQLTKKKLPFEVLVVDSVDRFPTEN